jgi:uncharacterized protein (DUF2267 family)
MDELVNIVVQRTGLSQEDARKAVQAVVDALKQRRPGPIASHLDAFLTGGVQGGVGVLSEEVGELLKGKLGVLGGDKS